MWTHDLDDADASCGGKAVGLARLIAAGLPVPEGFAVNARAFGAVAGLRPQASGLRPEEIGHELEEAARRIESAELPEELVREVEARVKSLGPLLAVRSSATIEDGAAGAAAGVFSSRTAVPAAEVWSAIRAVWASALTPLAAAYARRRGGAIAIGVIVQRYVEGERLTVYTEDPVLVQRADRLDKAARDDTRHEVQLAIRAEAALAAADAAAPSGSMTRGGAPADVELVAGDRLWVVQARPIVRAATRELVPPPPSVLAILDDGRTWRWDVAHNPDPLSPAQQGLVERVAELGPWSLRVCAGFLYSAPKPHAAPRVTSERELFSLAHPLEARLDALVAAPPASLQDALDRYVAFYRIWAGELSPLVSAARRVLPEAVGDEAIAASLIAGRASAVETILYAAARGELSEADAIARLGVLSPAWDIAVPTYNPAMIRDGIARARAAPPVALAAAPTRYHADFAAEIQLATAAADLAERDDILFARAQLLVRHALLAHRPELGDDVFWLPLDDESAPDDARRRASAARAAAARAARWQMPVVVGAQPLESRGESLRGVGSGPRVSGRVVRFASLASAVAVGPGDVVVTRAVTPALAVLVVGCAALVSETGGLLDHGAALARELGITCVVGCRDAWTQLYDGMLVTVDGAEGSVETMT